MKNILLISILFCLGLGCDLKIQKFESPKEVILIQSECYVKEIMEVGTDRMIDITHISESQVTIETFQINEENDYIVKLRDANHKSQEKRMKIVQNTDQLKQIQERLNQNEIQNDYKIAVDNLTSDVIWGIIKGIVLLVF
ncbi:unnamed protein product (macronuclear) [Paramecium tetraurelia]|uniref:GOLD domain-containing protein n=1 Tax=Paramecium tetraurelia TaxID=5888 RepID=A0BQZ0_PARTE|nr:uncharacterized protein GSPATT00031186001 [Paramecium tetraurelia]CAK60957.1 unnamed protein product [Paramecium tetraurelia]|eukprot:XP_001428355.1 hypothetical protein (macronuclear) [Paramecium tetraurelia strain d4-2]